MSKFLTEVIKFLSLSLLVSVLIACGGAEERKLKYLEKGKSFLTNKNYDKARIEIKNVLQIDPKFAEAYFLMGEIEEDNKELGKALSYYKKAIELDSNYIDAKLRISRIYVIAGTDELIAKALEYLKEVKEVAPDNNEEKIISASIEYKTGSKRNAVTSLAEIVRKNPTLVSAVSLLSSIYMHEGSDDEAKKLLEKAASLNSKNVPIRLSLVKIFAKNNDLVNAEKYLKQAINIEPDSYRLQVALASFYITSDKMDKAESILRESIRKNNKDTQRYLVLIEMLAKHFSIKRAEEEFISSIRDNPDMYELKFSQVKFYKRIGKREEAKSVLKKIIDDESYDVVGMKARTVLAGFLLEEGEQQAAKLYVDEVLAEYPSDSDALIIKSKLNLTNLDSSSAINSLRTVVKDNPKNTDASLLLAQAHEMNNESSLAETVLKKALEENPVNDQVHINYARYLASKGRNEEAIKVTNKALTYFNSSYDLMSVKLKVLASQGNESEILTLLNLMEQTNDSKDEVNIIRGKYFLSKKQVSKAIEQFEVAYKKSRDKYKSLQLIIKSYVANKQVDQAISRLQKQLKENSDDAIASLLLGQVYVLQNDIEKARARFNMAIEKSDAWFLPYSSLAVTYVAENDIPGALNVYHKALNSLKNKIPAQIQIAALYEKNKEYQKAMLTYENILSDSPDNKLALNNYSSLLLDFGDKKDGLKALDLVRGFEKLKQPALRDTLAWAYAKTGDYARAIEILKPIVEKAPKVTIFRYHLAYALYFIGDKAAAKSHLEVAVSSEQIFIGKDKAVELLKSI